MHGDYSGFRRLFRAIDRQPRSIAISAISALRKSRPINEYPTIVAALRTAAPNTTRTLFALGRTSPFHLVYELPPLAPVSIQKELAWAQAWLSGSSRQINRFRTTHDHIQTLVLAGRLKEATDTLDSYVKDCAWSLWAVELRAALLRISKGADSAQAWLIELQSKTKGTIPGLLFEIFAERNDENFSYDAFYSKCMRSFPRFQATAPWLPDYLKYRTLSQINDAEPALPNILSRDLTSSLVDYYEGVVESLQLLCFTNGEDEYAPPANQLLQHLIEDGYDDLRLHKLAALAPSSFCKSTNISTFAERDLSILYLESHAPQSWSGLSSITDSLQTCLNEGAPAIEEIGKLLKWTLNIKGLDIAPAIATIALWAVSPLHRNDLYPISPLLLSRELCIHDVATISNELALEAVKTYRVNLYPASKEIDALSLPEDWTTSANAPKIGPFHVWLAQHYLARRDHDNLEKLLKHLATKGPFWERTAAKFRLASFSQQGNLSEGLAIATEWLLKGPWYASELPCEELFQEFGWSDFRAIDPVITGIVAHFTSEASDLSKVSYICKMACRAFLNSGMRESVESDYDESTEERRAQLICFFREVWIEQNLAMCHQFESTSCVRSERMSVLQLLLGWDTERAPEYAQAIKELTFEQTLKKGLERIDQTRIFVNESAITRWAEKDLLQDFERWRRLVQSGHGGRPVDDLLRSYAVDPSNEELLSAFAISKPTAADALLIDTVGRLYKRFLLDPTDGLDTYLSVRIRHGSFRGTILGALEEERLLSSSSEFSEDAFNARWRSTLNIGDTEATALHQLFVEFSKDMRQLVDDFVSQRVQIASTEKPNGLFPNELPAVSGQILAAGLAERPVTFHSFLYTSYFVFWKLIDLRLADLRQLIITHFSDSLRSRIADLITDLRQRSTPHFALITALTTVSTITSSQCEAVGDWFKLSSAAEGESYELADAISIATAATRNVYRLFPNQVELISLPDDRIPLTTSALSILMDCLFVTFENAWKHSDLGDSLPPPSLRVSFDPTSALLTLETRSALSSAKLQSLEDGELLSLQNKHIGPYSLEIISSEGGSGFAKLARLTQPVPTTTCPAPFEFGVIEKHWFTRITVPLYLRSGMFEAFE